MKKIIVVLSIVLLSLSNVNAGRHGLKHANPMPNLMRIASGNAELLEISKDQMNALRSWGKTNRPKMMMLVKQVMRLEHEMRIEALGSDKDVLKKAEKMLSLRKEIIIMKTTCRKMLKSILNAKQYTNVISIYKSMHRGSNKGQCRKQNIK